MKKLLILVLGITFLNSCTVVENISESIDNQLKKSDPYSVETSETTTTLKKVEEKVTEVKKDTVVETVGRKIEEKFDSTDEKIVNFIAEKVHEDSAKIKEITLDGIEKLQKEKNIKMTKREFLARSYQIIKDNNITSYYLAAGRLINEVKK